MTGSRPESPHLEIPSHYHFLSQSLTLSPRPPLSEKSLRDPAGSGQEAGEGRCEQHKTGIPLFPRR